MFTGSWFAAQQSMSGFPPVSYTTRSTVSSAESELFETNI